MNVCFGGAAAGGAGVAVATNPEVLAMIGNGMGRLLVAGFAAAAFGNAPAAHAQSVMKMASATINDVQHEWLKRFEAAIKPRVGDKLKIEIYPASQLGQIPRMVEGVAVGTIESFVTPTAFLVGVEPRFQTFDAIGVFGSTEHANRVLGDETYRRRALSLGEEKGLKGIGIFYNSPIVVLSKRPIQSLADFKGKKIRVFGTPLQIEPIKALGGLPVPMAFGEVLAALQNGTVDGMLAGMPVLTPMKFYDAAKAVTEIHPSIVVSTLVVNRKWFDSLPADVQVAIVDTGARIDKDAHSFAAALMARADKDWVANGGQLLRLPAAEQAQMMTQMKTLGAQLLSGNPMVKAEYDELVKVADRYK
ncbi:MAG: TRAP transporter substrate-binding protein [Betaproteobacteria bacterium]|nr:TRAP transporter substrate-binding protein [Betaproteobacteria bacterium]